ncbi:hypothetical protein Bbelb_026560 [Branchiostoma belcheri]|nr:hypothetical protein Bbelb_026560 [Branchiostoma belcheri]
MTEKTITTTLALLCLYGFFKDMRPAVPFLTPFLRSDLKNYTAEEVNNEIYPILSYSWMASLFLVLLIADFVRYKPVLVVGGASYVATSVLWLWGERLEVMQIAQVVYGLATATETVYFSYIYVIVEDDYYQKATGYVRCTTLLGQFLASTISQIVISFDKTDYLLLHYITLEKGHDIESGDNKMAPSIRDTLEDAQSACVKNEDEITNVQNLWYVIEPASANGGLNNGIAEAITTLLGALVSFSVGYMKLNWSVFGELTLGVIFQVARLLSVGRYALVFGCNNLLALTLQAAIVAVVVDKDTLNTGIRAQRRPHNKQFRLVNTRTQYRGGSFLPRTVRDWNGLESVAVEATSVDAFVSRHPAATGLFLGPAVTREEFNSDLNSTRVPLTKRRRDRAVRTPTGTPPDPVAGSPPGHICYVTDQMNRIKVCASETRVKCVTSQIK